MNEIYLSIQTIYKIIDYLLLNAYATKSKGLYNGKSGIAIALFEVAKFLKDDNLEEQAFILIQDSLIGDSENINFESGESGIGFALLYLIQNKFIDTSFDDIFSKRYHRILAYLHQKSSHAKTTSLLSSLFFLGSLPISKIDSKLKYLIHQIEQDTEFELDHFYSEYRNSILCISPIYIVEKMRMYLNWKIHHNTMNKSIKFIKAYLSLIQMKRIIPDLISLLYLNIANKTFENINLNQNIIQELISTTLRNLNTSAISLKQHLTILYLIHNFKNVFDFLERPTNLIQTDDKALEDLLISKISPNQWIAGYGYGLSRLLLYYVFNEYCQKGYNTSRFQILLG